jgi:hypothetical protein
MLEEKQCPLPCCPEPVSVVVCSVCLHEDEKGWVGSSASFQNHKRGKHPDALGISTKAQKVRINQPIFLPLPGFAGFGLSTLHSSR